MACTENKSVVVRAALHGKVVYVVLLLCWNKRAKMIRNNPMAVHGFCFIERYSILFKYFNTAGVFLNRRINEDEIKKMKSVNFESINLEKTPSDISLNPY